MVDQEKAFESVICKIQYKQQCTDVVPMQNIHIENSWVNAIFFPFPKTFPKFYYGMYATERHVIYR